MPFLSFLCQILPFKNEYTQLHDLTLVLLIMKAMRIYLIIRINQLPDSVARWQNESQTGWNSLI